MKIKELYRSGKTVFSLEVFPPKKEDGIQTIYDTMGQLQGIDPDFVSVTYSAGGSGNANQTLQIAKTIKEQYGFEVLHHLTCVNNSRAEIDTLLQEMGAAGIENVLALRGDLPQDGSQPSKDFSYAKELITEIKDQTDFCVAAACYPEGHISQAADCEDESHLQEKAAAGADFFISQLFFDNQLFYRMLDQARQAGIQQPISAGVMPILSQSQVSRMIFMCGSSLPAKLIKLIHRYGDDLTDLRKAGLEYAMDQIDDLVAHGVDGVHLYTMNRPEIAIATCQHVREGWGS